MGKSFRIWIVLGLCAFLLLSVTACGASPTAEKYPSKPIVMIVPYKGGSYERLGRWLADDLKEKLGQPVAVEVIPGADGWNRIYRAKPDGYTIGVGDIVGEYLLPMVQQVPYKLEEFTWLGRMNAGITLIAAGAHTGIKNLDDLKRVGQQKTLRYAGFGMTSPGAQVIIMAKRLGIKMVQVDFPGPRETVIPVIRGDADLGDVGTWIWIDQVKAGQINPLMVWDVQRDKDFPQVPTVKEAGLSDIFDITSHRAVVAPPKLPANIRNALTAALKDIYASDKVKKRLIDGKLETNPLWGDDFTPVMKQVFKIMDQNRDALVGFYKN